MPTNVSTRRIVVAITGASAMPVAWKMLCMLARIPQVHLGCIVSRAAQMVWDKEGPEPLADVLAQAREIWDENDLAAGPASGSWWRPYNSAAMIVMPCSMNTLGALASGYAANLIQRAGAVALKEGVKLILVPRETPLSAIVLRNMQSLREAGAVLMPFCPAFYFQPQTLDELCEQFCCRILDQLDLATGCPSWDSVLA